MKIQIRRWVEIKNKEAFSEIYEIDENTLRTWVLNRIAVPEFSNSDEMKNWVMNINYLVEPISGYPEGTVNSSINKSKVIKPSNITIVGNDKSKYQLTGRKYTWEDDNIPKDFSKLQNLLQEERSEILPLPVYGSWSGSKKKDMYHYDSISVDHLIGFITYNENVVFKLESGKIVEGSDADSEYWEFL